MQLKVVDRIRHVHIGLKFIVGGYGHTQAFIVSSEKCH